MKNLVRIGYNKNKDEYQLLISTDGGQTWDFSMSSKCMNSNKDAPGTEPMFISCALIEELKKTVGYGYKMVF